MQYKAFISYSHAGDPTLPATLHRSLERFAKPWYRVRSFRVFRDRTNLSIAPGLWPRIESALLDSEFLLFLASPAGAQSKWVRKELGLWMERKDPSTMLIVLIEGEIVWDDAASDFDWTRTTALPETLRGAFPSEPLYVDLRPWRGTALRGDEGEFIDRVATIAATLRGVAKDEIIGEHLRQHRRTLRVAWSAGTVLGILAATATGLGIRARRLQLRAEHQVRVANAQRLAAESRIALQSGYPRRGVLLAAEALKIAAARGEPRVPAAEEAIRVALASVSGRALPGHPADRSFAMQFSADGRWLATETNGRIARLWDLTADDPGAKPIELHDELQPYTIAFSADGKWMITGAWITPNQAKTEKDQSSIRLWNLKAPDIAKTRIALRSDDALNAVALSPDGRRVATAGVDGAVRVWDLASPDPSASPVVLRGHHATVLSLVFGSDSRHVVSGGGDGAAIVWDIDAPGGAPKTLSYGRNVTLLAVTPDGQKVVTGDHHARPSLWNLQKSPPAQVPLDRVEDTIHDLRLSPDGRWLLTWGPWAYASLTDLNAKRPEKTNFILPAEGGPIEEVAFTADGSALFTACGYAPDELAAGSHPETAARLWALEGPDPSAQSLPFNGHTSPPLDLAVTPDNQWLITCSFDKTVRVWNLGKDRSPDFVLRGSEDMVYRVAVSQKTPWIAAQSGDGTAYLWNLHWPPAVAKTSPIHIGVIGQIKNLEVSRDGRWMFGAAHTDTFWDLHEQRPASTVHFASEKEDGPTKGGVISRNSRWLAIGHDGGKLRVWHLGATEQSSRLVINDPDVDFSGANFIGDRDLLAVHTTTTGTEKAEALQIVKLDPKQIALSIKNVPLPPGPLQGFNASPDGRLLVTTGADRTIRVWTVGDDAVDPKPVELTDTEAGSDAAFTPDGKWLMSASWTAFREQKTIRLWRVDALAAGAAPVVLEGHAKSVTTMKVSNDGHWLASAAYGERLLLWNLHADPIEQIPVALPFVPALSVTLSFSNDGRWLMASVYQHPPYLWRLDDKGIDGAPIVLAGHQFPLVRTAISPDSHWIVTADDELEYEPRKGRTCRVWDLTAPDVAGSSVLLPADDEGIGRVQFSPDGRFLITDGHSEGVELWHMGVDALLDLAARVAGRPLSAGEQVALGQDQ